MEAQNGSETVTETTGGSAERGKDLCHLSQDICKSVLYSFCPFPLSIIHLYNSCSPMTASSASIFDSNSRVIQNSLNLFINDAAGTGDLVTQKGILMHLDQYQVSFIEVLSLLITFRQFLLLLRSFCQIEYLQNLSRRWRSTFSTGCR